MAKHPVYICLNCLSSISESQKQPKCTFCGSLMAKKDEILEKWIDEHSPEFATLFNDIIPFYNFAEMIDEESADFDNDKYELKDKSYELLNRLVDEVEKRLNRAVVLHTTGIYMQEFDWDDFEFDPPIDLTDPSIRIGFLFFLDTLSLAMVHAILRDQKYNNMKASLSELSWAHKYFNHLLRSEAGGIDERKEPKLKWPVVIHSLFANYIPPIQGINSVWRDAELLSKNKE
ncbi:MAG: hypothetical protein ACFFD1_03335 [Candidatus Thorarchaeota archaeon]